MSNLDYNPSAQYEVATTDVVYFDGPTARLMATVYQPQGSGPFPGLLNIHGGAWNFGQRSDDAPMLSVLAASGLVVVAVDYRVAPEHPYPAQVADTNFATRWFKARAPEFNVAPESIGGMGCSSGGHTVMLSALCPRDPQYAALPLDGNEATYATLRYVLGCWPVLDPYARYLYAKSVGDNRLVTATENYFPAPETMHQGNPQEILERGDQGALPPTLVIQGTDDGNVPLSIPQRFEETFRNAGGSIEVEMFPGMPHGFGNRPQPESVRAIEVMKGFIARQLSPARTAV